MLASEMNIPLGVSHQVLDNLYDGLYLVDRNRVITYWNKAAERITGFCAEEVVGRTCADNILTHVDRCGRSLCTGGCPLALTLEDGQARKANVYLHHKAGHRLEVSVRVTPLTDAVGNIAGGVELFSDVSGQHEQMRRTDLLEQMTFLDDLTGLSNRTYIERELEVCVQDFARLGRPFALLFIDIDHFQQVNQRFGERVGNDVLQFVANTFMANCRSFDLYGRWGGDQFVGVVPDVCRISLEPMLKRLQLLVEHGYIIRQDQRVSVTVSVGAALTQPGDTAKLLLKRADQQLKQSKRLGCNRLSLD